MNLGLGSGENGELTFLDMLSVVSFLIGVRNLQLNVTQEDAQNLQKELSKKTDLLLQELHGHLEQQDEKINEILNLLRGENYANS